MALPPPVMSAPELDDFVAAAFPHVPRAHRLAEVTEGGVTLHLAIGPEYLNDDNLAQARALNDIAARRGQTLAQLAIAWVLRDERVTSALIGASSVEQLEHNLAALANLHLSPDELTEIDRYAVDAGMNSWPSTVPAGMPS